MHAAAQGAGERQRGPLCRRTRRQKPLHALTCRVSWCKRNASSSSGFWKVSELVTCEGAGGGRTLLTECLCWGSELPSGGHTCRPLLDAAAHPPGCHSPPEGAPLPIPPLSSRVGELWTCAVPGWQTASPDRPMTGGELRGFCRKRIGRRGGPSETGGKWRGDRKLQPLMEICRVFRSQPLSPPQLSLPFPAASQLHTQAWIKAWRPAPIQPAAPAPSVASPGSRSGWARATPAALLCRGSCGQGGAALARHSAAQQGLPPAATEPA